MADTVEGLPTAQRVLATAAADERSILEAFLDFYRDAIVRKIGGLSDEAARRRLVARGQPSPAWSST